MSIPPNISVGADFPDFAFVEAPGIDRDQGPKKGLLMFKAVHRLFVKGLVTALVEGPGEGLEQILQAAPVRHLLAPEPPFLEREEGPLDFSLRTGAIGLAGFRIDPVQAAKHQEGLVEADAFLLPVLHHHLAPVVHQKRSAGSSEKGKGPFQRFHHILLADRGGTGKMGQPAVAQNHGMDINRLDCSPPINLPLGPVVLHLLSRPRFHPNGASGFLPLFRSNPGQMVVQGLQGSPISFRHQLLIDPGPDVPLPNHLDDPTFIRRNLPVVLSFVKNRRLRRSEILFHGIP